MLDMVDILNNFYLYTNFFIYFFFKDHSFIIFKNFLFFQRLKRRWKEYRIIKIIVEIHEKNTKDQKEKAQEV